MRITKAIREYITDEINEMYRPKFTALTKEENDLKDLSRKIYEHLEEHVKEFNQELKEEFLNIAGFAYGDRDDITIFSMRDITWWVERKSPQAKSLEQRRAELNRRRDKSIRNTIAMLELGGSRTELDEALQQLREELDEQI